MHHHTFIFAFALLQATIGCSGEFNGFGGEGGAPDGGAGGSGGEPDAGGSSPSGGSGGDGGSGGEPPMLCSPGAPICDDNNTATLCAPDGSGPLPDGNDCGLYVCALGVCEQDMLVYLPLDEGVGVTTIDKVSLATGDVVAGAWADGAFSQALDFNTAGAAVDLGDALNSLGFPLTLSAWVHADPSAVDMPLVRTDSDAPGNSAGAWLTLHAGGQISVGFGNAMGGTASDAYRDLRSTLLVPVSQWTHVAGVITSMNDMTIYIDGVDALGTLTGTAQTIGTTAGTFRLANANWAGSATQYLGGVDDVRIYSRALSSAEVALLAAGRHTP